MTWSARMSVFASSWRDSGLVHMMLGLRLPDLASRLGSGVLGQTLISMMILFEDGALGLIVISRMIDLFFFVV